MMIAVLEGYSDIVQLLLEKQKGKKDNEGHTALYYTMYGNSEGHEKCYQLLNKIEAERKTADYDALQEIRQAKCTCGGAKDLFEAAEKGCCACCRKYID